MTARQPLRVRCGECDHRWILAYTPLPLARLANLAQKAACPKGCTSTVYIAERDALLLAKGLEERT